MLESININFTIGQGLVWLRVISEFYKLQSESFLLSIFAHLIPKLLSRICLCHNPNFECVLVLFAIAA